MSSNRPSEELTNLLSNTFHLCVRQQYDDEL